MTIIDSPAPGKDPNEITDEDSRENFAREIGEHFAKKYQTRDDVIVEPNEGDTNPSVTTPAGDRTAPGASPDEQAQPAAEPTQPTPAPEEEVAAEEEAEVDAVEAVDPNARFQIGERELTGKDLQDALGVYDWAKSLQPQHINEINALFSGQYVLVPADQANQPAQPATPAADTEPDFNNSVDPDMARELHATKQQLAQMREEMQQFTGYIGQQQQQSQAQQIDSAVADFRSSHDGLTEDDVQHLAQQVANQGILPALISARGGNVIEATKAAFEQTYWADPMFRAREMERAAQQQQSQPPADVDSVTQIDQQRRSAKRKASALSSGGAAVPRETAIPTNSKSRHEAMVGELANHFNNQSQIS